MSTKRAQVPDQMFFGHQDKCTVTLTAMSGRWILDIRIYKVGIGTAHYNSFHGIQFSKGDRVGNGTLYFAYDPVALKYVTGIACELDEISGEERKQRIIKLLRPENWERVAIGCARMSTKTLHWITEYLGIWPQVMDVEDEEEREALTIPV